MASSEHNAWVKRVLGFTIPDRDPLADLRAAYRKLEPALGGAAEGSQTVAAAIEDETRAFEEALATGNAAAAREALFALDTLSRRTDVQDATQAIPSGTVAAMRQALEKAQNRWDEALSDARSEAAEVLEELHLFYPEQARIFEQRLDGYWQAMADGISDARARDDGDASAPLAETATQLRNEIQSDDALAYLSQNGVLIGPAFTTALEELQQTLAR